MGASEKTPHSSGFSSLSKLGRSTPTVVAAADVKPKILQHKYEVTDLGKPTWCQRCESFLWGFSNQGWQCSQCQEVVCATCAADTSVAQPCSGQVPKQDHTVV